MYPHYPGPQNVKTGSESKYIKFEEHYCITVKSKTELPTTKERIKI